MCIRDSIRTDFSLPLIKKLPWPKLFNNKSPAIADDGIKNKNNVKRNDEITLEEISHINPDGILLSPGPGNPDQSGICLPILQNLSKEIPILGVCLGHQALAQAYGGKVIVGKELMHGKTSKIIHNKKGLFKDIDSPFVATRYHLSLIHIWRCRRRG